MKRLRLTGRPDPDRAPEAFLLVADSAYATEARLLEWTLGETRATLLFAVDGDREGLAGALADAPAVDSVDATAVDDRRFLLLVTVRPGETSLFADLLSLFTREGLVVRKPLRYRDGRVRATIVGDPAVLQELVDGLPSPIDLTVHEVGAYDGWPEFPAAGLSDRQREAVAAALELGYYDDPRGATHEDVAAAIGCAPSTAGEHLRKAESTLVRAAMRGERPDRA